jgi:hypothetical protein
MRGGRSSRNFERALISCQRALPQSPAATAPSRNGPFAHRAPPHNVSRMREDDILPYKVGCTSRGERANPVGEGLAPPVVKNLRRVMRCFKRPAPLPHGTPHPLFLCTCRRKEKVIKKKRQDGGLCPSTLRAFEKARPKPFDFAQDDTGEHGRMIFPARCVIKYDKIPPLYKQRQERI